MEPTALTQQLDQSTIGEVVDDVGAAVSVGGSYTYGEGVGDGEPRPARFSETKKAIGVHRH